MRYARKLLLVAVMAMAAMAAMAMMSSAASAQNVQVLKEPNNGPENHACTPVVMDNHVPIAGNCRVRAVSTENLEFYLHESDVVEHELFSCSSVFEAVFNTDGSGFIYNQVLTPEEAPCFREACDEPANPGGGEVGHRNLAWPAQISEPVPPATGLKLDVTFCLRTHSHDPATEGTAGVPCHVTLDLTVAPASHNFVVATPPGNHVTGVGGAPCEGIPVELMGRWVSSRTPAHPDDIEVLHTL